MKSGLSQAFALTLFAREVQLVLGLLTSVLLARWLGPEAVGTYFLVVGAGNLVALLGTLGLSYANTYLAAKDRTSAGRLFTLSLLIPLVLALAALATSVAFPRLGPLLLGDLPAGLQGRTLAGGFLLVVSTNLAGLLYGLDRLASYAALVALPSAIVGGSSVALILADALTLESAVTVWLWSCIATVVASVVVVCRICLPVAIADTALLRASLGVGFRSLTSALLSFATGRGTVVFVNQLMGKAALGHFSLALRLAELLQHLPGALSTVIFSRTSSRDMGPREVAWQLRVQLLVTGAGALLLALFAPAILALAFGDRYAPATGPVRILALGHWFLGAWNVAGGFVAGRRAMPWAYVGLCAFATGSCLALYPVLIPGSGLAGAAWAWTIPNAVTAALVLVYFLRISDGEATARDLVPGAADVAWLARAPAVAVRQSPRLRAAVRHARTRWRMLDEHKPWKRSAVARARAAAAAARARPRESGHAVFLADNVMVRQAKLACALRAAGWRVTLLTAAPVRPALASYFPDVHVYRDAWHAIELAARYSPLAYHVFADWVYETPATFIRHAPGKVVLDVNDVAAGHTRPERLAVLYPGQAQLERYCVEQADALCCRSLETQYLKTELGYRFRGPRLFFPDYTVSDTPAGARREPDGEIHVVHTGVFIPETVNPAGRVGHFLEVARILAADRVHFHLYECTGHPGTVEEVFGQYLELERETPYFHFHRFVPPEQLLRDMLGYDFGLFVAGIELTFRDRDLDYTNARGDQSLPNRIFEYLRCGLPMIVHDGRFLSWYASRLGVAHVVDPGFLSSPRAWLEKRLPSPADRAKLVAGQAAVDVRRHGPRLVRFYESLKP